MDFSLPFLALTLAVHQEEPDAMLVHCQQTAWDVRPAAGIIVGNSLALLLRLPMGVAADDVPALLLAILQSLGGYLLGEAEPLLADAL